MIAKSEESLPPSLESILAEISSSNLLVNNLFQLRAEGPWRASLREGSIQAKGPVHFGEALSASAALESALQQARTAIATRPAQSVSVQSAEDLGF